MMGELWRVGVEGWELSLFIFHPFSLSLSKATR